MYTQALTLKEHPRVSLDFPPVGLQRIVLHLKLNNKVKWLPFTLDDSLGVTEDGRECSASGALDIHKEAVGGLNQTL